MVKSRLSRYLVGTFAFCYLSAMSLVFCSSTYAAPVPTPPADCAALLRVIGTLKSVTPQGLQINKLDATSKIIGSINATYSSTTHIIQVTPGNPSILKKGDLVFVEAKQNADGSYTALGISLMPASLVQQEGQPSTDAAEACMALGQQKLASAHILQIVGGTVSQISGNTLVVTDQQQKSYTMTLAPNIQVGQPSLATSSALKPNAAVMVQGPSNNGVVAAVMIQVAPSPEVFAPLAAEGISGS